MKKPNKPAVKRGGITVTFARFGADPIILNLAKNATVEDAIEAADVTLPNNAEFFVGAEAAATDDILEDGDVLVVSTPKQAGA